MNKTKKIQRSSKKPQLTEEKVEEAAPAETTEKVNLQKKIKDTLNI